MDAPAACPFTSAKRTILHKLRAATDYSPKGSVDAHIVGLIGRLNALRDYATTSSCSGRVALYCHDGTSAEEGEGGGEGEADAAGAEESTKGRGRWLLVEHGAVAPSAVAAALAQAWPGSTALLKVEPFILHVQARDLGAAVRLLAVALRAGFRESGIVAGSSGRGKLIVAVRSTAGGMDAPLQWEGNAVVRPQAAAEGGGLDPMFLQLVAAANARMAAVEARRARFVEVFEQEFQAELAGVGEEGEALPPQGALGVPCAQCGARFASRNQLFARHLVKPADGTRPVCPAPAAPAAAVLGAAPPSKLTCTGCGHCASSRNALFRHVAACTLAPPRRPAATAPSPSAAPATALDAEAVAARAASRALLQRVAASAACQPPSPAPLPPRSAAATALHPIASGLLRRWGHCTVPLAQGGRLVVFGGCGGEGVHGRRNDLVLVDPATGAVQEIQCSSTGAGGVGEVPSPRVRATMVPIALSPASATTTTTTTTALLFGGHCGPATPLSDAWLLRLTAALPPHSTVTAEWVRLGFVGGSAPSARYGHSLLQLRSGSAAVLYGGRDFGASLGDCWVLEVQEDGRSVRASIVEAAAAAAGGCGSHPGARFSHAAALVQAQGVDYLLVQGGFRHPHSASTAPPAAPASCEEPSQILGDMWALDCSSISSSSLGASAGWHEVTLASSVPLPAPARAPLEHSISTPPSTALQRFSHTLTALQPPAAGAPAPSTTACLLLGGECKDPQRVAPLLFHLTLAAASASSSSSSSPRRRLTATVHYNLPGLVPVSYGAARAAAPASMLPTAPATLTPTPLLIQHTATLSSQGDLVVLGGGAVCFAFGSTYSPSFIAPRAAVQSCAEVSAAAAAPAASAAVPPPPPPAGLSGRPLIALPPSCAQSVKAELQSLGWFDWQRKVGVVGSSSSSSSSKMLGIPLTDEGHAQLVSAHCPSHATALLAALAMPGLTQLVAQGHLPAHAPLEEGLSSSVSSSSLMGAPVGVAGHRNDGGPGALQRASRAVAALIAPWLQQQQQQQQPGSKEALLLLLCTPGAHPGAMPRRVEWLSDVLLLPQGAFECSQWVAVLAGGAGREEALWRTLGSVFHTARVARGARIDAGGTRASHLTMLLTPPPPPLALALPPPAGTLADAAAAPLPPLPASDLARLHTGSGGWVRVREGGLCYAFDATRCMFSSGNVSEKARMGRLECSGETLVDLFAGIGYFTLPALVRARAAHVHAAEWNPDAVACLRINLALAGMEGRCSVWPGDNGTLLARAPALRGVADRVLLGLIPSSRCAWGTALGVLKPRGGVLHVHENVREEEAAQYAAQVLLPALRSLAAADAALAAHGWAFSLRHCERVKSYAPKVAHFVFDVVVARGVVA